MGDVVGRNPLRGIRGPADRVLVRELDVNGRAVRLKHPAGDADARVVLVDRQVFPPELPVGGGIRLSVRPLHAFAQIQGEGLAVGRPFITLNDARLKAREFRVPLDGRLGDEQQRRANPGIETRQMHGVAILADRLARLGDLRLTRQAFIHRGKAASVHQACQHRRFFVLGRFHGGNGRGSRLDRHDGGGGRDRLGGRGRSWRRGGGRRATGDQHDESDKRAQERMLRFHVDLLLVQKRECGNRSTIQCRFQRLSYLVSCHLLILSERLRFRLAHLFLKRQPGQLIRGEQARWVVRNAERTALFPPADQSGG